MKVYLIFSESFDHPNVAADKFLLDVDANDSVANLKVLITLRYNDLDPQ